MNLNSEHDINMNNNNNISCDKNKNKGNKLGKFLSQVNAGNFKF